MSGRYDQNVDFWTQRGERFTVVGDWLGRIPALELLDLSRGEKVVDAGCGTGWMSQLMSREGAEVFACDNSEKMLQTARTLNGRQIIRRWDIRYSDITKYMQYDGEFCDAVLCNAVLIHIDPQGMEGFFQEAHRILKPGGRIVTSVMHPYLFNITCPTRKHAAQWTSYRPVEPGMPKEETWHGSRRFIEDYVDIDGQVFTSEVWCHRETTFRTIMKRCGFNTIREQSNFVTSEVLNQSPHWKGGPVCYPAFYQILAIKE